MSIRKIILVAIGSISLGIGTLGIFLPILPTFPFFLLTAICFAKSSERLHKWFLGTDMYINHLETYLKKEGMRMKTKASIVAWITVFMGFGFIMMSKVPVGRWILAFVWICHVIYFVFGVKTIREETVKIK